MGGGGRRAGCYRRRTEVRYFSSALKSYYFSQLEEQLQMKDLGLLPCLRILILIHSIARRVQHSSKVISVGKMFLKFLN